MKNTFLLSLSCLFYLLLPPLSAQQDLQDVENFIVPPSAIPTIAINDIDTVQESLGFRKTRCNTHGTSASSHIPMYEQIGTILLNGLIRFSIGLDNDIHTYQMMTDESLNIKPQAISASFRANVVCLTLTKS